MEPGSQPRGVFFDESDARAVVGRLTSDGWEAALLRDRFQGEDDDEDHPWIVASDAPALLLELLVEEYDGWLDPGEEATPPAPPVDLPAAPKRIKRNGGPVHGTDSRLDT